MRVSKIGIPAIMPDNEMFYLAHIMKSLSVIDDNAELVISKSVSGYGFTLRYSEDKLKELLQKEIRAIHITFGLDMEFSHFKDSPYITWRLLAR